MEFGFCAECGKWLQDEGKIIIDDMGKLKIVCRECEANSGLTVVGQQGVVTPCSQEKSVLVFD